MGKPVILSVATLAAIAGLVALGFRFDLSKSDWASWVQAVGSITAIGASVYLVQRQHRLELDRQRLVGEQAQLELELAALQLVSAVHQIADKTSMIASKTTPKQDHLARLCVEMEGAVNAVGRVDFLRFNTHLMVEGLLVAESSGKTLLETMRNGYADIDNGDLSPWAAIIENANHAVTSIRQRADAIKAVIDARFIDLPRAATSKGK